MKPNIVWFDIPSTDLDRAIRFYSAVLDRPIERMTLGDVPIGFIPTSDGGMQGDIVLVKDFKPSPDGIMLYFDVDGRIKAAIAAVRAHGGVVQKDLHSLGPHGFCAEVLDSEGNCIALHARSET